MNYNVHILAMQAKKTHKFPNVWIWIITCLTLLLLLFINGSVHFLSHSYSALRVGENWKLVYVIFGFKKERFMCWWLVLTIIIIISGRHWMYRVKWSYLLIIDTSFVRIWCSNPKFPTWNGFHSFPFSSFFCLFLSFRTKPFTQWFYVKKFQNSRRIVARILMNKCSSFTAFTCESSNKNCSFLFYFMLRSRMWIALKILTQYAWMPNFKL